MRTNPQRLLVLLALCAAPLAACADSPTGPGGGGGELRRLPDSMVVTRSVRGAGDVFEVTLSTDCRTKRAAAAALAGDGFASLSLAGGGYYQPVGGTTTTTGGTSALMVDNGGTAIDCGCPLTVPPPRWIPTYTCKLVSQSCTKEKSQVSCNYRCEPPAPQPTTLYRY